MRFKPKLGFKVAYGGDFCHHAILKKGKKWSQFKPAVSPDVNCVKLAKKMNKTAIECWNILKYEIESIIDKFVPFQKQGKRCRKKHLSKEAIRKIMLKQTMWRVYRRTRKEEDYAKYKEALNAATTEIRQSKRSYEQKLACNIKNDNKFLCICQE